MASYVQAPGTSSWAAALEALHFGAEENRGVRQCGLPEGGAIGGGRAIVPRRLEACLGAEGNREVVDSGLFSANVPCWKFEGFPPEAVYVCEGVDGFAIVADVMHLETIDSQPHKKNHGGVSDFGSDNDMDPRLDEVVHLPKLSAIEEMLISPIISIMSAYRLEGGRLASPCFCRSRQDRTVTWIDVHDVFEADGIAPAGSEWSHV